MSDLQVLPLRNKADPAAPDLRGHVPQHLQQRGERLRPARGVRGSVAQPAGLPLLQPVPPVAPVGAASLEVGARGPRARRRRHRPPRSPLASAALVQLGRVHDALFQVLKREDDPLIIRRCPSEHEAVINSLLPKRFTIELNHASVLISGLLLTALANHMDHDFNFIHVRPHLRTFIDMK